MSKDNLTTYGMISIINLHCDELMEMPGQFLHQITLQTTRLNTTNHYEEFEEPNGVQIKIDNNTYVACSLVASYQSGNNQIGVYQCEHMTSSRSIQVQGILNYWTHKKESPATSGTAQTCACPE